MSSENGPKYIYAQENKLHYYNNHFRGQWENENWKKMEKQSEEYFFHQHCKKMETNTEMASRIWLTAYIVRLFDSHIGLFGGIKYI